VDVDVDLPAPCRPHANARLRGDARGRNGSVRQELGQCGLFSGSFLKFGPVQTPHPPQREGVRGVGAARARASLSSGEIYGCLEFGSSTC
jgi:hypothetical protein